MHAAPLLLSFALTLGAPPDGGSGRPDEPSPRNPLAAGEIRGTWAGERDGIKVKIHFKGTDDATWFVDTRKGRASAMVACDLKCVADRASGALELRFNLLPDAGDKRPFILMGRLRKDESGTFRLTILPDALKQSENYLQRVEDFPLTPIVDQK